MRFFAVAALLLSSVALAAPSTEKTKDCCCCDISQPAIVCEKDVKAEDCICAAVVCPANASTYWPATATPTAKSIPTYAVAAKREDLKGPPCCCCDPSKNAIVCEVRAQGEDNTFWSGAEETGI
ncbi:hypothetical protein ACHAP5_002812 [Fusarium lateritium]